MPDSDTKTPSPDREEKGENSSKRGLQMAIIEHASRPIAYVFLGLFLFVFLLSVREPLSKSLESAAKVKMGSFEFIREEADNSDLGKELQVLVALNRQQIILFIIIGKFRATHTTYGGEEVTEENLRVLKNVGLLSDYTKREDGGFDWTVSEKGDELHSIIMRNFVKAIKEGDPNS